MVQTAARRTGEARVSWAELHGTLSLWSKDIASHRRDQCIAGERSLSRCSINCEGSRSVLEDRLNGTCPVSCFRFSCGTRADFCSYDMSAVAEAMDTRGVLPHNRRHRG